MNRPLYTVIAETISAMEACKPGSEWYVKHSQLLADIERDLLPSGSGFDRGTKIIEESWKGFTGGFQLHTSFHHMNDHGYYIGWSDHTVVIKPCLLSGIDCRVTGRNMRDIKDHIGESVFHCLTANVEPYLERRRMAIDAGKWKPAH